MSVLKELGIVIDTNPSEVPSFKKSSGINIQSLSLSLSPCLCFLYSLSLSLIMFISYWHFYVRVVHEVHCPATKKNKEWQEKLPIVVLKAEEIMYSKANSEVSSLICCFFYLTTAKFLMYVPPISPVIHG